MSESDTSTGKDDIKDIVANAQALHGELSSLLDDMEQDEFWSAPYEGESDKFNK
jgi:hypothetical protein